MESPWHDFRVWFWGTVWTIGSGFGVAGADILDDLANYDGPIDWAHAQKRFVSAALIVLAIYVRKQIAIKEALYTPAPLPSASEALKKAAERGDRG